MLRRFVIDAEDSEADFFGYFSANTFLQCFSWMSTYLFSFKAELGRISMWLPESTYPAIQEYIPLGWRPCLTSRSLVFKLSATRTIPTGDRDGYQTSSHLLQVRQDAVEFLAEGPPHFAQWVFLLCQLKMALAFEARALSEVGIICKIVQIVLRVKNGEKRLLI